MSFKACWFLSKLPLLGPISLGDFFFLFNMLYKVCDASYGLTLAFLGSLLKSASDSMFALPCESRDWFRF